MTAIAQPCGACLVGSVPLASSEAVFATASAMLGGHLRRIPDGETGVRTNWIQWQLDVLADVPQFEIIEVSGEYGPNQSRIRIKPGSAPGEIEVPRLGYAAAAIASYRDFSAAKQAGSVAAETRFQVSLPTPLAPIHLYVIGEDQAAVEAVYETRMLAEVQEICTAIPHDQLAIQWDTAVEFGVLEGVFPTYLKRPFDDVIERLKRLGDSIPPSVELGYHLCYGDAGHKHFTEPTDTGVLVKVANGVIEALSREIQWLHLPVPITRSDVSYFEPMRNLNLDARTELYLGVVHMTDGVAGAQERIAAAKEVVPNFGIATECGFGRRSPDSVSDLMNLHAQLAEPLKASVNK